MNESKTSVTIGGKKIPLHGKFKLSLKRDPNKFHMASIESFIPVGKTINDRVYFYNENGRVNFILLDKMNVFFNPDQNEVDAMNITSLIQHPNVRLEGMSDVEHMALAEKKIKKENPEYTLVNLDKQIMDENNDNVDMIEIQYLIVNRKNPLSKKKLMYITSALNLSIKSQIQDEERYIVHLQNQLIRHLKGSEIDREKFRKYYENIAEAELLYFINEFITLGIIKDFGGMYKIEDRPVGMSVSDIKNWYASNEDMYEKHKLEVQQFHSDKVSK